MAPLATLGYGGAAAMYHRLPMELIEEVLDFLDETSFEGCSLVCRSWLQPARSRLWSRLTVYELGDSQYHSGVLRSRSKYIRELSIYGGYSRADWLSRLFQGFSIERLTSLRKLHIESFVIEWISQETKTAIVFPLFAKVQHLHLQNIRFATRHEACRWICASDRLTSLTLTSVTWSSRWYGSGALYNEIESTPPPPVRCLTTRDGDNLHSWFLSFDSGMTHLSLGEFGSMRADVISLESLLSAGKISPTLQELELTYRAVVDHYYRCFLAPESKEESRANFGAMIALRSFSVAGVSNSNARVVLYNAGDLGPVNILLPLLTFMKHLNAPNISTYAFKCSGEALTKWSDWGEISNFMMTQPSRILKLIFPDNADASELLAHIFPSMRNRLSDLDAAGRLWLGTS